MNYPVARFDRSGRLDPAFSLLELPRFFGAGRVLLAPDGGIVVTYFELGMVPRLRRLLPDGRPDEVFESGFAQTLRRLDHGPVRAAAIGRDGRVWALLKNDPLDEALLIGLGADGRLAPKEPAAISGKLGPPASWRAILTGPSS